MASIEAMLRKAREAIALHNTPVDIDVLVASGLIVRKSANRYLVQGKRDELPAAFWAKVTGIAMTSGGPVLTLRLPRSTRPRRAEDETVALLAATKRGAPELLQSLRDERKARVVGELE